MGDVVLRGTIAVGTALYALAEWRRFRYGPDTAARAAWTAAAVFCIAHAAAAFELRHGWSHTAAYEDTARQLEAATGWAWGGGLYVNYLFYAVWIVDVLWWWARPRTYRTRPRLVTNLIAGFFLFMFLNGAVVFAGNPMRAIGAAAVVLVTTAWYAGRRR